MVLTVNDDRGEHTPQNAREYVASGQLEKAAEAYGQLLDRWPNRQDLAEELAELERHRRRKKLKTISIENRLEFDGKTSAVLLEKMKEWVQLIVAYKRLRALNQSKERLQR